MHFFSFQMVYFKIYYFILFPVLIFLSVNSYNHFKFLLSLKPLKPKKKPYILLL